MLRFRKNDFWDRYGFLCSIAPNSIIHESVKIDAFVTIGSFGFGFENENDTAKNPVYKMPLTRKKHDYPVIIDRDVEIGSHTNIDAGSWRPTHIEAGTKIDSHVKIAHNVIIRQNCLIVAGTVIGGSCTIGDNCSLGIGAELKQRLKIADNITIGMGSVVRHDITQSNSTWAGNPCVKIADTQRF